MGCEGLTTLILPESMETIGASAFRDCVNLKSIVIPAGVTKLGDIAFKNCDLDLIVWTEENSYVWKYCDEEIIDTRPWDGSIYPRDGEEDTDDEDDETEEAEEDDADGILDSL